ncbi:hypothetical protein LTR66_012080 [Elasticomyces elasticus]|nr:hypothetical protein LTR66_012080 [Elasticomyces elasticus]
MSLSNKSTSSNSQDVKQVVSEQNVNQTALAGLLSSYHELNPSCVDELHEEPSALEFMRYVARNRPFVVRGAAVDWKAFLKWDAEYLLNTMGSEKINVAITPFGNADAVVFQGNIPVFIKPYETSEAFDQALGYIQQQEDSGQGQSEVKYLQTQNDNLRNEYEMLFADVPKSIPFARIALEQQHPDAVNFWLGNSHSVTSLHKDNYENVYVQIRGQKHFVLLSPVETACVNEKPLPAATYERRHTTESSGEVALSLRIDELAEKVPVAIWDPDAPDHNATPMSHLAQPLRVTLNEGDMLYLPALWYHKVSQSCGNQGYCCAVNYWYDMDFGGDFWAASKFIRDVALQTADK